MLPIDTTAYVAVHDHEPHGPGCWVFQLSGQDVRLSMMGCYDHVTVQIRQAVAPLPQQPPLLLLLP